MGLNLLIKPVFIFGIDRQIQNLAGPEAYGTYYALFSFSLLLSMLLDAGLSNYNARQVAMQPEKGLQRTPALLGLRLMLFVLYALLTLGAGWLLNFRGDAWVLLFVICVNQGLNYTLYFLRSNLQGLHRFVQDGSLSVLDRALTILFCLPLLNGYRFSSSLVLDFALLQCMAYALSTALALYWNSRFTSLLPTVKPVLQLQLLKQTLPFALLGLLMTFYARLDAVMIVQLLPNGHFEAGQYAAAYRLLDAFSTVPLLLSGLLLPIFSRQLRQGENTGPLVRLTGLLLLGSGWILGLVGYGYRTEILELLYTHNSPEQERLFSWLMWTYLPIAGMYVFGSLLTAAGHLRLLNILSGIGLVTNILLNLLLIPVLGVVGAAIATFITQSGLLVAQIISCQRRFAWQFSATLFLKVALFMVISGGLLIYGHHFGTWTALLLSAGLSGLSLLLLFPERWKQLRDLVR